MSKTSNLISRVDPLDTIRRKDERDGVQVQTIICFSSVFGLGNFFELRICVCVGGRPGLFGLGERLLRNFCNEIYEPYTYAENVILSHCFEVSVIKVQNLSRVVNFNEPS